MTTEEIISTLRGEYMAVRLLPDGTVACLGELLFTRGIFLGCDEFSWKRRFCFEDRERASAEFALLQSEDDVPSGYTARRL